MLNAHKLNDQSSLQRRMHNGSQHAHITGHTHSHGGKNHIILRADKCLAVDKSRSTKCESRLNHAIHQFWRYTPIFLMPSATWGQLCTVVCGSAPGTGVLAKYRQLKQRPLASGLPAYIADSPSLNAFMRGSLSRPRSWSRPLPLPPSRWPPLPDGAPRCLAPPR